MNVYTFIIKLTARTFYVKIQIYWVSDLSISSMIVAILFLIFMYRPTIC